MTTKTLPQNQATLTLIDQNVNRNKKRIQNAGTLGYENYIKKLKAFNKRCMQPNEDQQKLADELDKFRNEVQGFIDDLIAANVNDENSPANQLAQALGQYNEKYSYVKFAGRVLVMQEAPDEFGNLEMKFYYPRDIASFHQNHNIINHDGKKLNVFNEWAEWADRKSYSGLMFDPTTTERDLIRGEGIYMNRWQGFSVEPEKGDDDKLYWELVKTGLCNGNEEYYRYVRKYLAHMIQKPTELPLTAIGIVSKQGAGKGAFVETVGELLGRHFNPNVSMRDLTGQFTGALKDVILGFVDEASWGGDKASAGELKRVITQKDARLELKGKDPITVPAFKRLIFASNNSYYYHADADDRRLLPLEPNEKVINKGNVKFWKEFWDKNKNGKMKANLLRHLMDEDISKFNPYEELRDMAITTGWSTMYESLQPHEKWMYHAIQDQCFTNCNLDPKDEMKAFTEGIVQREQLNASYETFKKSNPYWAGGMSARDRKMNTYLKDVVGENYGGNTTKNGLGRCYRIDWEAMKTNFETLYRYQVEWDVLDENVIPIETGKKSAVPGTTVTVETFCRVTDKLPRMNI